MRKVWLLMFFFLWINIKLHPMIPYWNYVDNISNHFPKSLSLCCSKVVNVIKRNIGNYRSQVCSIFDPPWETQNVISPWYQYLFDRQPYSLFLCFDMVSTTFFYSISAGFFSLTFLQIYIFNFLVHLKSHLLDPSSVCVKFWSGTYP